MPPLGRGALLIRALADLVANDPRQAVDPTALLLRHAAVLRLHLPHDGDAALREATLTRPDQLEGSREQELTQPVVRVGGGDVGTNAQRIREYLDEVREQMG